MPTRTRNRETLISILFPVIGVGLLLIAAASIASTYSFIQNASKSEGQVIQLVAGGAHPIVQFTTLGGKVTQFQGAGLIDYAVGDKVTVLYLVNTESPSGIRANIDSPGALWFTPLLLTSLGVAFLGSGLYKKYSILSRN
jgi:hypothetical protein